jgi:hypothetical protein
MSEQTEAASPADERQGGGWRESVAPEYRKIAEKFVTPADVVRSYAELERKLGSAVHVPGEQADEAERARFYERIGRPKRVEDYAIDVPVGLPDSLQPDEAGEGRQRRFLEHAHRAGLTRNQAQAAINWYYGELANEHTRNSRARGESFAEAETSLRSEWGGDYDRNVEYGRRAMAQFGNVDAVDRMEETLGTSQVLRMMARIGRALGEAGTVNGGARAKSGDLKKELDTLIRSEDYWSNRHTQKRVREIHDEMYGARTVVGANGRGY